ncbi:hypothetical protein [Candidatus Protochlamydia phocaeensis]|uniref:hypothetical protein n=1 Tax=Candidatus Protochlamydia phocaeensis TaxID=1414722 RepID=UPI000837F7C4|nr:hypothetical protein [Candidatus Protochlamydia phocaeensis]
MKRLNKNLLDFDLTWEYVQDNLDKTNVISSELLSTINFKKGYFFTLLPDDANLQAIHKFNYGGILPQNPIQEYFVDGHRATFSIKKSVREELSLIILKEINAHTNLSCIFDDVNFYADELIGYYLFDKYGLSYEKEAYYLLKNNEISLDLINECLRVSNASWHSLCLLTSADLNKTIKILTFEKVKEICLATELIILGAYDAEGYVFWESKNASFFD